MAVFYLIELHDPHDMIFLNSHRMGRDHRLVFCEGHDVRHVPRNEFETPLRHLFTCHREDMNIPMWDLTTTASTPSHSVLIASSIRYATSTIIYIKRLSSLVKKGKSH